MIFLDTETCGFTGPCILIQYAVDDGPIILHNIFKSKVSDTLKLIVSLSLSPVVGFNLAYDWFHINKIYNILIKLPPDIIPTVEQVAEIEKLNPNTYCIKPPTACDIMLFARQGPYQTTMNRKDIVIRRIPRIISEELVKELKSRVEIPDIYFVRRAKGYSWDIQEINNGTNENPEYDPDFVNIILKFAPSTSLNSLAISCLGKEKGDYPPMESFNEVSYLPYGSNWPDVISNHIYRWSTSKEAQYYATQDVVITRELYHYFKPPMGEDNSLLACSVGATRWKGFNLNHALLADQVDKYKLIAESAPIAPREAYKFLQLNAAEKAIIKSTQRSNLEALIRSDSPSKERAALIMKARSAAIRLRLLKKLHSLPRYHPEMKVLGTKSNRMSGGNEQGFESINPHGIPRDKDIRACFTLADENEQLYSGDAVGYEVTIMDAEFKDPKLHEQLLTGKKFHNLIASKILKVSYADVASLQETDKDKYTRIKSGVFGWAYGAQAKKFGETVDIPLTDAELGLKELEEEYPGIKRSRMEIFNDFCSMRQPGGLGSAVIWSEPKDYVESLLGFKRYFTLENNITRALFKLANKPPASFKNIPGKVMRRDRYQTPGGATQSAIYAAAFNIQSSILRQAGNHKIQSVGAEITKKFQLALESYQPTGINKWVVRTINLHDEIPTVTNGTVDTFKVRDEVINKYRKYIPLLKWEWAKREHW